jgi:hypothetical protein
LSSGFKRKLRTASLLLFILVVVGLLVYSRIMAYSLAPTLEPADFSGLAWYEIPIYYLWDYVSHAWICLLFAFTAAGLVYEFMPKDLITRYMGSNKISGYLIAAGLAPLFTVCSCTMVPLFAGILYTGAGIGPAITFLLMAPAANVLTILVTGEFLSWEIAAVRIVVSLMTALIAGVVVSKTPWGKATEKEHHVNAAPGQRGAVELAKPPLDERLIAALKFGGFLAKQILPYFIVGLIVVGYVTAYMPESIVEGYLTGVTGVLIASIIGGPLYTPTLVEVVVGRSLLQLGMSRAALLSWLMGQPYDVANMTAVSKITGWRVVVTYALTAWSCSVIFSLVYGILTGSL